MKYWLPALLWMALIFSASGDPGSFTHSSRIIGPFVKWLFPSLPDATVHTIVVVVRKGAHVTEYAVLALILWRALRRPAEEGPRGWDWRLAAWTLLLVCLYAASDEFHQRFVATRQASVMDVAIDTLGGVLGLTFLWIVGRWRKRW